MEIPGVKIEGTFNAQRFFDTLAMILSRQFGVEITAKVIKENDNNSDHEPDGEKIA